MSKYHALPTTATSAAAVLGVAAENTVEQICTYMGCREGIIPSLGHDHSSLFRIEDVELYMFGFLTEGAIHCRFHWIIH